jgi:major membrane immunogen (membrane-anchored lipoprotein)
VRPSLPIALVVVVAILLAGCGGSDETSTSSPLGSGASKQDVRAAWERTPECKHPQGASRWGCSVGPYRCQGAVTDRGWSISCAKPGGSVAFTVRRG